MCVTYLLRDMSLSVLRCKLPLKKQHKQLLQNFLIILHYVINWNEQKWLPFLPKKVMNKFILEYSILNCTSQIDWAMTIYIYIVPIYFQKLCIVINSSSSSWSSWSSVLDAAHLAAIGTNIWSVGLLSSSPLLPSMLVRVLFCPQLVCIAYTLKIVRLKLSAFII